MRRNTPSKFWTSSKSIRIGTHSQRLPGFQSPMFPMLFFKYQNQARSTMGLSCFCRDPAPCLPTNCDNHYAMLSTCHRSAMPDRVHLTAHTCHNNWLSHLMDEAR